MDKNKLTVISSIIGNIVSVVGVVIINKYIAEVDGYNFMLFMSSLHFTFTYLGLRVLMALGFFSAPTVPMTEVIPVAVGSLLSVAFMNLNLSNNSVGFYQLSKLACIPFTLIVQFIAYKQTVPRSIQLTLLPIIFGVGYATVYDVNVNLYGTIIATAAVVATSMSQIFTSVYQKNMDCNPLQLLYLTSPMIAIGMIIMCPFFDGTKALALYSYSYPCIFRILLTCVFALFVNITNYSVIGLTSPLTYQVLGHLKTVLIIVLGFVMFRKHVDMRNLIGIVVAMAGVVAYTELKRRQSPAPIPK